MPNSAILESSKYTLIKQSYPFEKIFLLVNNDTLLRLRNIMLSIIGYFLSTALKHNRQNFEHNWEGPIDNAQTFSTSVKSISYVFCAYRKIIKSLLLGMWNQAYFHSKIYNSICFFQRTHGTGTIFLLSC